MLYTRTWACCVSTSPSTSDTKQSFELLALKHLGNRRFNLGCLFWQWCLGIDEHVVLCCCIFYQVNVGDRLCWHEQENVVGGTQCVVYAYKAAFFEISNKCTTQRTCTTVNCKMAHSVCVCVCVWRREWKKKRESERDAHFLYATAREKKQSSDTTPNNQLCILEQYELYIDTSDKWHSEI